MIKYLRDKIIGRPAVFSRAGDIPIDDNLPPVQRANSQNSLNDTITISVVSMDIASTDRTITQAEKPPTTNSNISNGGRRPGSSSSSPIIIPKKTPRSNASSQSSSSYTSVVDQMSSFADTSMQLDDNTLPTLSSTCQQLEHSAARDRISVKNQRRQPIKQKLSTLRETDDGEHNLFSSKVPAKPPTPNGEQIIPTSIGIEAKIPQPLIDLSDLDKVRARLRVSIRARDRSADNIILATKNTINDSSTTNTALPSYNDVTTRSSSLRRSNDMRKTMIVNDIISKSKSKENINENTSSNENVHMSIDVSNKNKTIESTVQSSNSTSSISQSSSHEHIYDNLDLFKTSSKTNVNLSSNEDVSLSTTSTVKHRGNPKSTVRLRPVTVHVPNTNDQSTINEFENVYNQLKKRGSIRKSRTNEDTTVENVPAPTPSPIPPPTPPNTGEQPIPNPEPIISANEVTISTPTPLTPNRRRTVAGVHLLANNKVATNDNKPAPSWIDIAKQKQSKFQSVNDEKPSKNEFEQNSSNESPSVSRRQVSSVDLRSNRVSMFEQPTAPLTAQSSERDSIRALKAGNPNRINNLIQFFDK